MSYYTKKFPEVNDIVYVTIDSFSKGGTYCNLIEYDNIKGLILSTELDRHAKDPKKAFKPDVVYPMVVLFISNDDVPNIDLSYKKVKKEDREKLIEKYNCIKKFVQFANECVFFTKLSKEIVYDLTIRKIFELFDDEYDNFANINKLYNEILENPDVFVKYLKDEHPDLAKDFSDNLKSRITSGNMEVEQLFELVIYDEDAVTKLKDVLMCNLENTNIYYLASPKYQIIVKGDTQEECDNLIVKCIDVLKEKCNKYKCKFTVTEKNVNKSKEYTVGALNIYDKK